MTEESAIIARRLTEEIREANEWLSVIDAIASTGALPLVPLLTEKGRVLWPLNRDYPGAREILMQLRPVISAKIVTLRKELAAL